MKTQLIEMIRELSYQKKNITLASGRQSDFYIDMKNTLFHPQGINWVAQLILEQLKDQEGQLKAVGGLTMGADPISTAVSMASVSWKSPLFCFYIRKEPKSHGTQQWVEGLKNLKAGDEVIILEDVVTSGGSSIKAAERAELAGLKVKGILTCVDREEGGQETIQKAGYAFYRLVSKSEILKA